MEDRALRATAEATWSRGHPFDAEPDRTEQERLRAAAEETARKRLSFMREARPGVLRHVAAAELASLKRERMNGMNEAEFRAYGSTDTLRAALVKRHRFDPLSEATASA